MPFKLTLKRKKRGFYLAFLTANILVLSNIFSLAKINECLYKNLKEYKQKA